jgi:uncharacterized membrane protein
MRATAISYLVTLVVFVGVDFVWLGQAGDAFYRPAMGDMVLPNFRLAPAIVFYLIFAAGLVFMAVQPAVVSGQWLEATGRGAVFGFCAYATYDLTNQATLKHWSTTLSIVDMSWGALLSAVAATCGYFVYSALAKP